MENLLLDVQHIQTQDLKERPFDFQRRRVLTQRKLTERWQLDDLLSAYAPGAVRAGVEVESLRGRRLAKLGRKFAARREKATRRTTAGTWWLALHPFEHVRTARIGDRAQ